LSEQTHPGLSQAEVERYSRQLVLPEIGPRGQQRLKASSAIIIGAGGLGIPASVYLAAAGVGRIGVVDDDAVEKSNLHRQTIYTEGDVGKKKALVAAERLRQVNPHVSIASYPVRLSSANALELLEGYDVVLDCTDNFPARYLINDVCVLLHKPDVYASIFRFDGQASVFQADKGPCYRCLFPEPPPADSVQDCAVAGVLGVLPGIMGGVQAVEALKLLLGEGQPLLGRLLLLNATDMTFNELHFKKNAECPVCGSRPTVTKLIDYEEFCGVRRVVPQVKDVSPRELKQLMDGGGHIVLLDVREPYEHDLCRIEGSKLIPLGELERRMGEIDRASEVVVYCHVGMRSARAVELLSSKGFGKVRNLKGGIRAWAEEVDRSVPIY
jgi:sulfur-carrier protein adenylyltransferase/sulfurtransferase